MDQNTELLLTRIAQPPRWEDEEKATNAVAAGERSGPLPRAGK